MKKNIHKLCFLMLLLSAGFVQRAKAQSSEQLSALSVIDDSVERALLPVFERFVKTDALGVVLVRLEGELLRMPKDMPEPLKAKRISDYREFQRQLAQLSSMLAENIWSAGNTSIDGVEDFWVQGKVLTVRSYLKYDLHLSIMENRLATGAYGTVLSTDGKPVELRRLSKVAKRFLDLVVNLDKGRR